MTALSDRFRSGGRFPAGSVIASILPGLQLLDWPVKCPLYARAIDIFGAAPIERSNLLSTVFPLQASRTLSWLTQLIHKPAHSNIHYHPQRQEHEQNGRPTVTH